MASSNPATQALPVARSQRLTIVFYTIVVFLYWMAQYIYAPTLPTYVQSKVGDLATVGLVLSMYGLWQAIIRLPLGIVADWVGWHKPFIMAGLVLAGLGAWTLGTAGTAEGLTLGRAITGLAAGAWVPMVVAFSGLFPPEQAVRASALLTLVNSTGRILATGATGMLNGLGGYGLAFLLATCISAFALFMMFPVYEVRRAPRAPSLRATGRVMARRDVLVPSLLSLVAQYANWALTYGFIPVLAKQMGASDVVLSLLVTLSLVLYTLGNLLATSGARRLGPERLVTFAFVLLFASIALAAFAPDLAIVLVAQLGLGLATGISYPVLMGLSIRYVDDSQRATAMGLHQAIYAVGMFLGPALSGVLANAVGIQPMFGITACGCLILGLVGTRALRRA